VAATAPGPRRKPILVFALQVAALLLALVWLPQPRLSYARLFHAQANLLSQALSGLGQPRAVRLVVPASRRDGSDTEMLGLDRRHVEPRWTARFKIFARGYWPVVAVLALVLATPLPWWRRAAAALLGALLVNAFTLTQVAALAVATFGSAESGPGAGEGWSRARTVAEHFFNSELPRHAAILMAWAVVAAPGRHLDLRGWARAADPEARGRRPGP
jgi:hypothetical protein